MRFRSYINRLRWLIKVDTREWTNSFFSILRRRRLRGTDFTIISNNCWAGHVYRRYSIEYLTPTIGMYFFPDDYLMFLSNLKENIELPMTFIQPSQSKHYKQLVELHQTHVPIAMLGDHIEIIMLHYHSEEEVIEKWNRRKQRINWDHILVKNSMQNGMTQEQVLKYDGLPFPHKIVFVPHRMSNIASAVWYKSDCRSGQVMDDIINFNRYINLTKWINSCY